MRRVAFIRLLTLPFTLSSGLVLGLSAPAFAQLAATQPRTEYLTDPLAIHDPHPRLSWVLETASSSTRDLAQSAYRILVASSPQLLAANTGDLWDSGVVASNATFGVIYKGKPLTSRQSCHWKVQIVDAAGTEGPWSTPATWSMGPTAPSDWSAQWIDAAPTRSSIIITTATYATEDKSVSKDVTAIISAAVAKGETSIPASNNFLGGDPAYGKKKALSFTYSLNGQTFTRIIAENTSFKLPAGPLPVLRKTFNINKPISRAVLYSTALGVYDISINGKPTSDARLNPGWTDFRKRVRYQTADVTGLLAQGDCTLESTVAPGWFSGRAGLFNISQFYGKEPALLAQLEISYADGTSERIISDASWKRCDGPTLSADLMDGEVHDARITLPPTSDPAWQPVTTRPESRNLEPDVCLPVRTFAELPAISLTQPAPGRYTYDLGQNLVGVIRLRVTQPKGTVITIKHGEMLNPDGTLYTANLRGAACIDTYTCSGTPNETWEPRFTFHGFRYVELTGLSSAPDQSSVTGIAFGSDFERVGSFTFANKDLNQLASNIWWGLRGNYLSIPTDCPQRDERMGWMADAQVFAQTAIFNADLAPFFTKWLADVRDAQREDGAHSDVAPVTRGLTYGTPAWADAGSIIPWLMYENYGDTRILEQSLDSMTRWVEWCRRHSTNLYRDRDRGNDYGDWLSIKADTPKDLIGTAYFAHSTDILARSLRVLGDSARAEQYESLHRDIIAAFNKAYVNLEKSADGTSHIRIKGDTQCSYILALRFNLLADELRPLAAARLVETIQRANNHLSTGFVGVSYLLPVLDSINQRPLAAKLLLNDTFPSWLFSVRHGATTIWERWDGYTPQTGPHPDISMNSFNHYSLGSCGQWFVEGIGGITQRGQPSAFQRVNINLDPLPNLDVADISYKSIRGTYRTTWKPTAVGHSARLTIPINCSALVKFTRSAASITESGKPLSAALSAKIRNQDPLTLELGSGIYDFTIAPQ
ncbi:MAG: family 78 glycoside hydrolase catalytic domain [Planctomycetes bacterium]|nr:family 78 glycoside hydrolase catalytic domain [Planctomycetota bacterium]